MHERASRREGLAGEPPGIAGLDHVVLTVSDLAVSRAFYDSLPGCEVREFAPGRWAAWVGGQKLNFHEAGSEFLPAAARPTPGGADLCFLIGGRVSAMAEVLERLGIEIIDGPVMRSGAASPIRSVYVRDPDGNLLEFGEPVDRSRGRP